MARQRLAEDRLAAEKRSAAFWRRQAEVVEEEAGALQTRAAAAEVSRAGMAEELDSERRKMKEYLQGLKDDFASSEVLQREAIETSMVQNRSLEIQFEGTQLDLKKKSVEVKVLQEILESKNQDIMKISKEKKKKFSAFGRGRRKTLGG